MSPRFRVRKLGRLTTAKRSPCRRLREAALCLPWAGEDEAGPSGRPRGELRPRAVPEARTLPAPSPRPPQDTLGFAPAAPHRGFAFAAPSVSLSGLALSAPCGPAPRSAAPWRRPRLPSRPAQGQVWRRQPRGRNARRGSPGRGSPAARGSQRCFRAGLSRNRRLQGRDSPVAAIFGPGAPVSPVTSLGDGAGPCWFL